MKRSRRYAKKKQLKTKEKISTNPVRADEAAPPKTDTHAQNGMAGTVYDDVFRTEQNDLPQLLIPLINEVFGEHYPYDAQIVFAPNEHFISELDGNIAKRGRQRDFIPKPPRQFQRYIIFP